MLFLFCKGLITDAMEDVKLFLKKTYFSLVNSIIFGKSEFLIFSTCARAHTFYFLVLSIDYTVKFCGLSFWAFKC